VGQAIQILLNGLFSTLYDWLALVSCPLHEVPITQMYIYLIGMLQFGRHESHIAHWHHYLRS